MTPLALYLLKANVALALFYLVYHLVLRQLTFYTLNRFFLGFGILFSLLFPFVPLPSPTEKPVPPATALPELVPQVWEAPAAAPAAREPALAYGPVVAVAFYAGAGALALLILVRLLSLYQIHRRSVPFLFRGIPFRQITADLAPFSFWQSIYANPARHPEPELEPILRHEAVHVRQWHTLDVLLAEVGTVVCWFNPCIWLLKKALRQNLEFLADRQVLQAGVDRKQYQYLLLQVMGASTPHLANCLHFPSLKKRIAMMNKPRSPRGQQLRFLVALPLLALLGFSFRGLTPAVGPTIPEPSMLQDAPKPAQEKDAFFARNPEVKGFAYLSDGKFMLIRRDEKIETYQLNNPREAAAVLKKYGELPKSPTPPPPPAPPASPQSYHEFLERNPEVADLTWTNPGTVMIKKKTGETEKYEAHDPFQVVYVEQRYGKLPQPPANLPMTMVWTNIDPDYLLFLKRNPEISNISGSGYRLVIHKQPGDTDAYWVDDENQLAAAEKKYGKLPQQHLPPTRDLGAPHLPQDYKDFMQRNPDINYLRWTATGSIVLYKKAGVVELYLLTDPQEKATAEQKYGPLPEAPPLKTSFSTTSAPAENQTKSK